LLVDCLTITENGTPDEVAARTKVPRLDPPNRFMFSAPLKADRPRHGQG
jgi:hypothetical protein